MADGHWLVESTEAYTAWAVRHRPNADEKGVVANWLAEREALGPPGDAVVDDHHNWTAKARDREFYFRREDLPGGDPAGYLFVMRIT
ncbi:MAG: hypothetical protein ACYDH6_14490 [Acidimicrobiales bacterium]